MTKDMTTDELFAAYFLTIGVPSINQWDSVEVQAHYAAFKVLVRITINSTGLPVEALSERNMELLYSRFIKYIRDYKLRRRA